MGKAADWGVAVGMEPYKHYFYGACDPVNELGYKTFSVGIFQAIPRANGNGYKRGPVKVRVRGLSSNPSMVYRIAAETCRKLDSGKYTGTKVVSVIGWDDGYLF